jgi:hypothetical protein
MSAPEPSLIGYFARRPWSRTEDVRILPPQVTDMCNVGQMTANGPPDWIDLWTLYGNPPERAPDSGWHARCPYDGNDC